jgi:hypothetical protein
VSEFDEHVKAVNTVNRMLGGGVTPEQMAEEHATNQTVTKATHDSLLRRERIQSFLEGYHSRDAEVERLREAIKKVSRAHDLEDYLGAMNIAKAVHELFEAGGE